MLLLVLCVGYFFISGESGSLWRATVMWILAWLGWWLGKKTHPGWILFQAVVLTFFLQRSFFSSASFWLSWLAMVGLLFSRQQCFRENNHSYFPNWKRLSNYLKNSFLTGWWVLMAVTLWLWTQYGVFQPHGIIVTWGIEPFIRPYMVLALVWKASAGLCQWWPSGACQVSVWGVTRMIELLFLGIALWLEGWKAWVSDRLRLATTTAILVGVGMWLSWASFQRNRKFTQRAQWW